MPLDPLPPRASGQTPSHPRIIGVAVDELFGLRNGAGKRGPAPKFQKQLEPSLLSAPMTSGDEAFFKALGARVAELRKEQGLSQQAIADELGLAQQTFAHYEVGRARMPVSLLPELARIFGVAVDELLGLRNGAGKRGPAPKFQKQLERIAQLPRARQEVVMQMLDGVLAQRAR